jgi:murein DD-endopeptidase MepM/ murein hydrolase activator NlpD
VELRGGQVFGRSGMTEDRERSNVRVAQAPVSRSASNYKPYEPPPVYQNTKQRPSRDVPQQTQQTASVQSISVNDLPPPNASKPEAVNRWTSKARDERVAESQSEPASKEVKLTSASRPSSFMWPVNSRKVISGFGPKGAGKTNDGINISSPEGEPVWASADGEVIYSGNELAGYGNMVVIKHGGNKNTSYAHLSRATVDKYDRVKQGDIIGYVGNTGGVKKPQLHFAVRDGKNPVDPKKFLSTRVAGI